MHQETATCINVSCYAPALVYGQRYHILDADATPERLLIKVRGAHGRVGWYPARCFDRSGGAALAISAVTIGDPLEQGDRAAIEVEILLSTGERRWCAFSTPQALAHYGDLLPDSDVRIHYGSHLIILTALTEPLIHAALAHLLAHNELLAHTQAIPAP